MNRRNTIILVVVFIALAGYAYFIQSRNAGTGQASATPSATPAPVFDFLTDNVVKFQVSDLQKNQTVVVTRQGEGWHMEQPKDSATDPARIGDALGSIAHLEAARVLTNTTDLSAYGLITPTIEVRTTMSDTTQSVLQIGDTTADKADYYALKGGDKQVYLISSSTVDTLRNYLNLPPYPPTPTLTPLPTLTPSSTPTVTPTGTITPPTATSTVGTSPSVTPSATSPPSASLTPSP
jgi:uncharacterized protein DUF4340